MLERRTRIWTNVKIRELWTVEVREQSHGGSPWSPRGSQWSQVGSSWSHRWSLGQYLSLWWGAGFGSASKWRVSSRSASHEKTYPVPHQCDVDPQHGPIFMLFPLFRAPILQLFLILFCAVLLFSFSIVSVVPYSPFFSCFCSCSVLFYCSLFLLFLLFPTPHSSAVSAPVLCCFIVLFFYLCSLLPILQLFFLSIAHSAPPNCLRIY